MGYPIFHSQYTAAQIEASIGSTPHKGTITFGTTWSGSSGQYTQVVTVSGLQVSENSKVDLQPNAAQLEQLMSDGVAALMIENNNGTLTAYALGSAPTTAMTMQCTVTGVLS